MTLDLHRPGYSRPGISERRPLTFQCRVKVWVSSIYCEDWMYPAERAVMSC